MVTIEALSHIKADIRQYDWILSGHLKVSQSSIILSYVLTIYVTRWVTPEVFNCPGYLAGP